MDEKTLIKALRKGNEAAVQQLIQQYYPPVYRYVCTKVTNQADAQDILQETFLRFMKQIPTYRIQEKLAGYLYRIASSCCIDHLRKEQRHRHLPIEEEILPNEISFQEIMMQSFEYEHLHRLLLLLPNEEQDIIYFYYLKQMNFREISELLDIPQSTLKSRHARALIHLRNLWRTTVMKPWNEPDPQIMQMTAFLAHEQLQTSLQMTDSRSHIVQRLIHIELRFFLLFSAVSFTLLLWLLVYLQQNRMLIIAFYFFFLGSYGVYATYRQSIYGMDELISICYINQGRLFLYKCAAIALVQLFLFMILFLFEFLAQKNIWPLFFSTLFPFLLIQNLTLFADHWISQKIFVLLTYLVFYLFYLFFLAIVPSFFEQLSIVPMILITLLSIIWLSYGIKQKYHQVDIPVIGR